MITPNDFPGKRKSMKMMLAGLTAALWLVVLSILLPRVAMGFEVHSVIGKRSRTLWSRSTTMNMSSVISSEKDMAKLSANVAKRYGDGEFSSPAGQGADDQSNADRSEIPMLLNPSSHPSRTFAAPNLEASFQPIFSDGVNGESILELLPLQKYHAKNRKRRRSKRKRRSKNNRL